MHTPYHLIQPSLPRQRGRGLGRLQCSHSHRKRLKHRMILLSDWTAATGSRLFLGCEAPCPAVSHAQVWGLAPGDGAARGPGPAQHMHHAGKGDRDTWEEHPAGILHAAIFGVHPSMHPHSWQGNHQLTRVRDAGIKVPRRQHGGGWWDLRYPHALVQGTTEQHWCM